MKRFILVIALFCFALLSVRTASAQYVVPVVDQTTPHLAPGVNGESTYFSGDELASLVAFQGTNRITNITFKYTSSVPINYTVRFYKLPSPLSPRDLIGPLVKTVTFTDLPAGTNVVTRELTPEQQFDWVAGFDYTGRFLGAYYSVQMTRTDGSNTGLEAGFTLANSSIGGWTNLSTGEREDAFSRGAIPTDPLFFDEGFPPVGFFINISGTQLSVAAPATLASLQLSPNRVIGGASLTGTLTMTGVVAEDTFIVVSTPSREIQVPSVVTIPAGARSASFPITTTTVTGNALFSSVGGFYAGKDARQTLIVDPATVSLSWLSLSTSSVRGGTGLRGTVTFSGPTDQARTVTISNSSNGAVVQTPATVTVPAGAQSLSFPITTSAITRNQTVVIQVSFAGKTVEQTLTVTRRR